MDLDTLAQESNRLTKQALRMFNSQNKNSKTSAVLWEARGNETQTYLKQQNRSLIAFRTDNISLKDAITRYI